MNFEFLYMFYAIGFLVEKVCHFFSMQYSQQYSYYLKNNNNGGIRGALSLFRKQKEEKM